MGVTLERVQNKFACIIGELCNEPYILSQFAIWVDFRIAEYKAKGSISLDCTGCTPDLTWLKGLKPPKSVQSDSSLQQNESLETNINPHHRLHRATESLRSRFIRPREVDYSGSNKELIIEDYRVVVKEEPIEIEKVFPISVHPHNDNGNLGYANSSQRSFSEDNEMHSVRMPDHDRTQPMIGQHSRKRSHSRVDGDVLDSSNTAFVPSSPSKSIRLSDNNLSSTSQDSNQSLLSVIGMTDTAAAISILENHGRGENSAQALLPSRYNESGSGSRRDTRYGNGGEDWQNGDIELIEVRGPSHYNIKESGERTVNTGSPKATHKVPVHDGRGGIIAGDSLIKASGKVPETDGQESVPRRQEFIPHNEQEYAQLIQEQALNDQIPVPFDQSPVPGGQETDLSKLERHSQRVRWSTRMNVVKPRSTHKNTVCAVRTLHGFLYRQQEHREIHTIPPEQLDAYLVAFFSTIKRKNGTDYHPNSLVSLRKFLDFHLKENGYPHSITTSPKFLKSQVSFKMKHMELLSLLSVRKASEEVFHGSHAFLNSPGSAALEHLSADEDGARNSNADITNNAFAAEEMQRDNLSSLGKGVHCGITETVISSDDCLNVTQQDRIPLDVNARQSFTGEQFVTHHQELTLNRSGDSSVPVT